MDVLSLSIVCTVSYISLVLIAKCIGHKQISQLSFFEYISGITIGSMAAEMATELEAPWKPLVAMVIYGVITCLLNVVTNKFPRTRQYLHGKPVIIMDCGKLYRNNMKKAKLDISEFMIMCREQGYFDLGAIETALFEYNGKLSILPKSTRRPTTPEDMEENPQQELLFTEVIMDGRIQEGNLKKMGFDREWLKTELLKYGVHSPKDVFLAVCDRNENLLIYENEP